MEVVLLRRWGMAGDPHPLVQPLQETGCTVHELSAGPRHTAKVLAFLRGRLGAGDLLHSHEFKSNLLVYLARRRQSIPWVVTDHHLAATGMQMRLFKRADGWALRRADAVVVPSRSQARRLQGRIPAGRVHTIYHGIDAAAFAGGTPYDRSALRARYGVAESQPLVSLFGRLEPVKGHGDFLQAAKRMLDERPELRFWIVGDGRLRQPLQDQVRDLQLDHAVRFFGYRSDVAALMAASDVVLMPSLYESFGIVLIEAMSLARPVVASAVGGIPEVLEHGVHGFLTAPDDQAGLARMLLRIVEDPALALRLGQAGQEHVINLFKVDTMVEKMVALYRHLGQTSSSSVPALDGGRAWMSASS